MILLILPDVDAAPLPHPLTAGEQAVWSALTNANVSTLEGGRELDPTVQAIPSDLVDAYTVRGKFVSQLLSDPSPDNVALNWITIVNVTVKGQIYISGSVNKAIHFSRVFFEDDFRTVAKFEDPVSIASCRFNGRDNSFNSAHFSRNLVLVSNRFVAPPDMGFMQVMGTLAIHGGDFRGGLFLQNCFVGGEMLLSGLSFDGTIDLENARLQGALEIRDAARNLHSSAGRLLLTRASISRDLGVFGQRMDFEIGANLLRVGGSLAIRPSSTNGPVDMGTNSVWFDNAFVGANVEISSVTTESQVRFYNCDIRGGVGLDFIESSGIAHTSLLIERLRANEIRVQECQFHGGISFIGLDIAEDVRLFRSKFGVPSTNSISFSQSTNSIVIQWISAGGTLNLIGNEFYNTNYILAFRGRGIEIHDNAFSVLAPVDWHRVECAEDINFQGNSFQAGLVMSWASAGRTVAMLANTFGTSALSSVAITNLILQDIHSARSLIIGSNLVHGVLELQRLPLEQLSRVNQDWTNVLDLINKARYSPELYVQLDRVLLKQQMTDESVKVLRAMYGRSLQARKGESFADRAKSFVFGKWIQAIDLLWAYGREPERLILWLLGVLLVCYPFFLRCTMIPCDVEPTDSEHQPHRMYSSFLYVVGLLIPLFDLPVNANWRPANLLEGRPKTAIAESLSSHFVGRFSWIQILPKWCASILAIGLGSHDRSVQLLIHLGQSIKRFVSGAELMALGLAANMLQLLSRVSSLVAFLVRAIGWVIGALLGLSWADFFKP